MTDEARSSDEAEVAALFARLRDEIANREPGARAQKPLTSSDAYPVLARSQAERCWAVTADRPFLYKPGTWGRVRGALLVPLKTALRKLMRWYVEPAFAQQRDFNSAVLGALDALSERMDDAERERLETAEHVRTISGEVEEVGARLDRSLTELDERLLRVERRLRRSSPPPATTPAPGSAQALPSSGGVESPDYFAFESRMRGSAALVRERQSVYIDEFRDAAPVLDVGCGRGEFLTLLREAGVEARGIDLDPEMVTHCGDEGLAVEEADAVAYLAELPDASLGGVFCAHVLEHLDPARIFRLLELAAAKVRPSGLFVAETPNPLSLVALANFSADLSHNKPLHPATLSFLARQAGFRDVELRFLSEPSGDERLRLVPLPDRSEFSETRAALDADVNRLNDVVFGPHDYAVLART